MEEDWDLQAVVRGCCSSSSSSNNSNSTATASVLPIEDSLACFPSLGFPENENFFSFPDLFETKTVLDEFEQLYKPFLPKFQPPLSPLSPLNSPNPISFQQQQLLLQQQQHRVSVRMKQEQQQPRRTIAASTTISTPRQKRRKNQQKKVVCQVPAEGLSSDMWAWRKYGQKPIKGSPYPRGYYRCSSSKGCLARKQVERSRSDPGMFVITYTAEHNHPIPTHRNSLAGSTRHKLTTPQTPPTPNTNTNNMDKPPSCSSSSPTGLSPTTPLTTSMEEEDDELMLQQSKEEEENDDDLGISEFQGLMTDDLFMELEQFAGPNSTDTIPIGFDDCFTSPHWFSATAAGSV